MADERDWTAFVEAGVVPGYGAEHAGRRELVEFLLEQGCTLEEMVEADRRGRLFGLAGDRIVRPGARALTLAQVAEAAEVSLGTARRLWRALGLPGWESDEAIASADDAAAFQTIVAASKAAGEDLAVELARSIGAALSRVAEAANSIGRSLSPHSSLATSASEMDTARYWAASAPLVAGLGQVLDVFARHHFDLARDLFERSLSYDIMHRRLTRLAVGFVDISGFTAATELLGEREFARLMASFTSGVDDAVRDLGGRVVKFVGDEAMIVAPDAVTLATIAQVLVERRSSLAEGLTLHGGLAQGELVSQDGDYFGSAVNLAARLVAIAPPGTVLATAPVGEALAAAGWVVEWQGPQPIRGIAEPVVTCVVHSGSTSD